MESLSDTGDCFVCHFRGRFTPLVCHALERLIQVYPSFYVFDKLGVAFDQEGKYSHTAVWD